jgi:hypothetical protein
MMVHGIRIPLQVANLNGGGPHESEKTVRGSPGGD